MRGRQSSKLGSWVGAAILGALAVCFVPAAAGPRSEASPRFFGRTQPPEDDVFRFTNNAEPEVLDPALLSGQPDQRIAFAIFEGLIIPDPETMQPSPGVAVRWEVSADGRTWTFHLRPDARWSNGDRVTARDFESSWRRVLHPDTPARLVDFFYVVRGARAYKKREQPDVAQVGIRALDDATLEVQLESPTPYFLQLVMSSIYLPVHAATVTRHGDRWTRPENIVGNGAFRLAKHHPNDRIVLAKSTTYWDAANVRLREVVVFASDDLSTMLNLYRAGITDWNPSGNLPAQYIPYVRDYGDFRAGPFLATYFYCFNVTRPPFDDVRVRRALSLAVDRDKITRYLLHESKLPWGGIVAPGFDGYPYPKGAAFDPEAARTLLAEAGYPEGRGFPATEILFNTSVDHRKIAEAIQEMWKRELGISVALSNQEFGSYLRATTSLQYQIARRSWIADYADPNAFLSVLRSGEGNNRTGWSDAEYDALLQAAANELDRDKRLALLARAEARALDAMPFMPIYGYRTVELVAPYVRGWYPSFMDVHPLKGIWIDRGRPSDNRGASR